MIQANARRVPIAAALLLAGTMLAGGAGPAWAQAAPPPEGAPSPSGAPDAVAQPRSTDDRASPQPTTGQSSGQLTDIVVSARRRDETLQQTPIAITAIQPSALAAKATLNIGDLQGAAPNVLLTDDNTGAGTAQVSIRGLSFADVEKSFDVAVGIVQDGVFLGTNTGAYLEFFDVDSIEILRGPQGTLFGRNTIGGVINIRRTRPTGEWGAKLEASYGRYATLGLRGVFNAPIVKDVLALKLFGFHNEFEGFYRQFYTGKRTGGSNKDTYGAALLFTPTPEFDALLTIEKFDQDFETTQSSLSKTGELFCNFAPAIECNRNSTTDLYTVFGDTGFSRLRAPAQTLEMNWDIGFTKLTSVTGRRTSKERQVQDFDGLSPDLYVGDRRQRFRQFSQELRAAGDITPTFDYVVGGYYYKSRYTLNQQTTLFGTFDPTAEQFTVGRAESYALFGDFDWQFAPQFRLSFGGRYTHDEKQNQLRLGAVQFPAASVKFHKFTPKVSLDYRPSDDLLVYASWSRGYRSGGFSGRGLSLISSTTPYGPETVDSYEVGFKSTLLDRKLFFNVAAFYAKYKDLQQNTTIPTNVGTGNETIVSNVGSATIKGIEADLTARPIEHLKIVGALGYLDSGFKDFITNGAVSALRPDLRTIDYSNVDLIFAPKLTGSVSATYDLPTSFGSVALYGSYRYLSRYDQQIAIDPTGTYPATGTIVVAENDPRVRSDRWNIVDAALTVTFDLGGTKATASLYGRNLLDDRGPSKSFTVAGLWSFSQVREPRTYGAQLGLQF